MMTPFENERINKKVFYGWVWLLSVDRIWGAFWYRLLTTEMFSHDLRMLKRKSKILFWISISLGLMGSFGILLSEHSMAMENILTTIFAWFLVILSGLTLIVWYLISLVVRMPISLWVTLKTARQAKNRVAIEKLRSSRKVVYINSNSLSDGTYVFSFKRR